MKKDLTRPKLFEYLNVASYLQDYLAYRKSTASEFSFAAWAEELGFKSRSYLRMVTLQKKRVTASFEASFAAKENFTPHEKEYFHFLIQYSQAKTQAQKQFFGRQLMQILRASSGQQEVENYFEFLSDPILPRLLTMLSFTDITPSASRLSVLLELNLKQTQDALTKLRTLGLAEAVEIDGEDQWKSKNHFFKVPNRLGDLAVTRFHENSLREAIRAFAVPHDLRRYRGLLLPMNTDELSEFYSRMDEFAAELTAKYRSDLYEGRRLFQVNLNIFPIVASDESTKVSE